MRCLLPRTINPDGCTESRGSTVMVSGKKLLAVFFLGVCVHAAYVVGLAVLPAALNLNEGSAFSLDCGASSTDGDVEWELNDKGIDPQALGFRVSQERTTTITANFTSPQHEGSYRCNIKPPQGGRILSCPSNVRKAVLEGFGDSSMVTAHAGGAAILPCAVPYSAPKASISLKRRRAQEVGLDSIQLLTSGRFYVEGLQAKDSGVYRCLADNNVTESRTRSPFFRLRVEAAPPNSTTFELTYNSPDTVARTGDDIFLGCTFEAATLPKYQWRYRGLNDANATRLPEKTSGLLELRAVKLENAGVYECEAYIKDGERTLSQSAPIVLTVKATPSEVTIAEERDPSGVVSLTCNVDPPGGLYNITWNIPDNATIDGSDGLSGDSITITPNLAASGVYQCLASNEFGCATGEKTLIFEGITSSPSLPVSPTTSSTFAPEVTQLFSPTPLITDEVVKSSTTSPISSIPDPTSPSTSSSSEVEPMATSADSSSAIPSRSMTSSVGMSSSSDVTSSSASPTLSLAVPSISSASSSSISVSPSVAVPSSSSVYRAASSTSPPAPPIPTPSGPQVNIDPSGELTVEEGDNVTVTCTSNVAGALLQLLILMDRFTSSHSVVASAEGTVLSHTFYFIQGSADGRYWCTLPDVRSENLEISVAAVAPTFKLENVFVHWVRDAKVNVSWSLPDPPPWMSVLGYKLNWDKETPIPIALMSVGAETSSVEVDVNFTGVVFISVWAFSRGGEGPPVLLNVTIPMTTHIPSTPTPKQLLVLFNPLEATVEVGSNITITCWSNQEAVLQLAYNQGPVLASSSGRSVIYTLVDVQENESGVIYCVGMVGEVSNTAEYHLTVCTPLPVYTMSCRAVSPSKIKVTLQGGPAPKGGFTVNYLQEDSLNLQRRSKVVSEGLSTTLTGLTPRSRYRIAVSVEGCDAQTIGPCLTETLVNLTLPSTEPGMTMSLVMFENRLEALRKSLAEEEIDDDMLLIEVNKGNGWEEIQFDDIAAIESDQRNITFRVRISEGPWAESVVTLSPTSSSTPPSENMSPTSSPTPPSENIDWTLFRIYIILLAVAIVLAIVVTCVVVFMKYIQIQRREKDKVTDHRDEQAKRLSRQGSTRSSRSTVSWTLKMNKTESPEVKI